MIIFHYTAKKYDNASDLNPAFYVKLYFGIDEVGYGSMYIWVELIYLLQNNIKL